MSKVFRLGPEGPNALNDWTSRADFPYNAENLDAITDPNGATARHEITSIPSPFARIDLIKTAFKEVNKLENGRADLDGHTIFHKMVSDTLDVAQIFFNYNNLRDRITIVKWGHAMIAELQNSHHPGHRFLGDSLNTYWESDKEVYNFSDDTNIYLLNYKGGGTDRIIGATSPATLFFSTANDLSFINDIHFGNDTPFDDHYLPLYNRDIEFVEYLFALRESIPDFAGSFPEIYTYLELTREAIAIIRPNQINRLRNVTQDTLHRFSQISLGADHVEVLGYPLYQRDHVDVAGMSQFKICSTKDAGVRPPLVLPVEAGNAYSRLVYTIDNWGNSNKAPYFDPEPDISRRTLPNDAETYPYLTISDFLEDCIIKVPYQLNAMRYFNGNLTAHNDDFTYLLPFKPLFFKYFTPEKLIQGLEDGRELIIICPGVANCVKVTLRIPINGNDAVSCIEYSRIYFDIDKPDIANNKGAVINLRFTGFIMPPIRFQNEDNALYNVTCIQDKKSTTKFDFYNSLGIKLTDITSDTRGINADIPDKADNYLIRHRGFDFIRVHDGHGHYGVVLPIFIQQACVNNFKFAVDLGTSNTHIECQKNAEQSGPLTLNKADNPLCQIFIPKKNEYGKFETLGNETDLIEKDYIPEIIDGTGDYRFPTRTVLSYPANLKQEDNVDPFTLVNIPFTFDRLYGLRWNKYNCDIKWETGNDPALRAYVRSLMLIMRNKALMNNGDLAKTQIIRFFPISMSNNRRARLANTWNDAYTEYFGVGSTSVITESDAPIQHFFNQHAEVHDIINIDIGGETTDVAFATGDTVNYVSSFRFASNAVFEDQIAFNLHNGITDYYKEVFHTLFEKYNLEILNRVYEEKEATARPSDWASFLFSLKDNSLLKKAPIDETQYDFNRILNNDEDFKIIFVIFYTSIIYH
ncbi:MAG: hypothetical protein LUC18_03960, partial [Porphyromonadaceae bacterium]|nr:hypothetical protein [Porphyromonadaceae bacterium]